MMMIGPYYDEDRVYDGHDRECPRDHVDHKSLSAVRGELIDDGAKQEYMDGGPNEEGPTSWGEIRLLDVFVDGLWGNRGTDARPQEEEVGNNVNDLEKETFFRL